MTSSQNKRGALPGQQAFIHREILHALLQHGREGMRQKDLGAHLHSRLGVGRNLGHWITEKGPLVTSGLIEKRAAPGSPSPMLRPGPGLGLVLAFSIGGERLIGALVGPTGETYCEVFADPEPTQLDQSPDELLGRVRAMAIEVLAAGLRVPELTVDAGDGRRSLKVIGVSSCWPTPLRRDGSAHGMSLSRKEWKTQPLHGLLADSLGLDASRAHALTDAHAAALAIAFDEGMEAPRGSIVAIHLSANVSSGIVHLALPQPNRLPFIDSRLVGGRRGLAGGIGHSKCDARHIDDLNERNVEGLLPLDVKRPCNCSVDRLHVSGHVQSVIGAEAVLARLGMHAPGRSLAKGLEQLHRETAEGSRELVALQDVGRVLGWAFQGTWAMLDPGLVYLSGPLACAAIRDQLEAELPQELRVAPDAIPVKPLPLRRERRQTVEAFNAAKATAQRDALLLPLRGAALAVLRASVYRGFFERADSEHASQASAEYPGTWDDWTGWDDPARTKKSRAFHPMDGADLLRKMAALVDETDPLAELALKVAPLERAAAAETSAEVSQVRELRGPGPRVEDELAADSAE